MPTANFEERVQKRVANCIRSRFYAMTFPVVLLVLFIPAALAKGGRGRIPSDALDPDPPCRIYPHPRHAQATGPNTGRLTANFGKQLPSNQPCDHIAPV